ncbi:kinase-like domain-containing protein [Syncephalis pseudoplumigaleata]|uniref:Kinase-like domain-containing protein n=1 Tax=Syncephalis pseudoplumigaleata TaxID=1712513 RepID=A0A4P9Z586_9FUNG|nr:kinase-like domain-containing protein [Syncephalis pseudoplumigaleata]|eukprot:RKP27784.1 kinase-like domain-containing protein [Syncephalis pseudoplumigaleata]
MRLSKMLVAVPLLLCVASMAIAQPTTIDKFNSQFQSFPTLPDDDPPIQQPSREPSQGKQQAPSTPLSRVSTPVSSASSKSSRQASDPRKEGRQLTAMQKSIYKTYIEKAGVSQFKWDKTKERLFTGTGYFGKQRCYVKCKPRDSRASKENIAFSRMETMKEMGRHDALADQFLVKRLHLLYIPQTTYGCNVLSHGGDMDMNEYMPTFKDLPTKARVLWRLAKQLVYVVSYLHDISIAHGDIKTENIMIMNPDNLNQVHITLIDFDIAEIIPQTYSLKTLDPGIKGTYGYFTPEEYLGMGGNKIKRDAWQIGSSIYDAWTGLPPYGYTVVHGGVKEWSNEEYEGAMREIVNMKTSPFEAIENHPGVRNMKELHAAMKLMNKFLIGDYEARNAPTTKLVTA